MNKQDNKYILVVKDGLEALGAAVNLKIKKGYYPIGGVRYIGPGHLDGEYTISESKYVQAMIRN